MLIDLSWRYPKILQIHSNDFSSRHCTFLPGQRLMFTEVRCPVMECAFFLYFVIFLNCILNI